MRILILGSEGFIGSNAVQYFTVRGWEVFSADIMLKEQSGYFLINPEAPDFSSIFIMQKFDYCLNATGAANVQLSFSHPSLDFILNSANVYTILDAIRQFDPTCKFINLSSAAVYGNPVSLPIKEDADLNPVSPYGFHKMYSEQICSEYFKVFNIHTLSLRVFSAYGEGLKKQLFWDLFKKVERSDGEIEMFGSGNETRDFIYINDLLHAIECIIINAKFTGNAVNIASGVESSIKEAVLLFLANSNKTINPVFKGNNKIGDPVNWRADISALLSYGFVPKYSLELGINNYYRWVTEKKSL